MATVRLCSRREKREDFVLPLCYAMRDHCACDSAALPLEECCRESGTRTRTYIRRSVMRVTPMPPRVTPYDAGAEDA